MPARIAALPIDPQRGVPVPWFVAWIDGKPDFRVIRPRGVDDAVSFRKCWICGQERGVWGAFVIGPMCAVNRTSSEPPSHEDCAVYAAVTCPFLAKPHMRRRTSGMPEDAVHSAGLPIDRNPGVALVWVTREWKRFRVGPVGNAGSLFEIGDPQKTLWFAKGREATRDEVEESIRTGLPLLRAEAERESAKAVAALERMTADAMRLLPVAEVSP